MFVLTTKSGRAMATDRPLCPSRDGRGPCCFNHEREQKTCCQCGAERVTTDAD